MAAVRNGNFNLDEVLNPYFKSYILNNNCVERPPNYLQKVKEALGSFTREKSCQNVAFFVDVCAEQVQAVLEAHGSLESVPRKMTNSINPALILQMEARLWLAGMLQQIWGKRSIKNPYYVHTNRDVYHVFIIVRIVRGLYGFV
jgi:hypothetical protein